MNILMVIDQYDNANNGTTMSTRRFAENLRELGHNVRVVSSGQPSKEKYNLPEQYLPLMTYFARKQGMLFAKPLRSVLYRAVAWADVVHCLMPFPLCKRAVHIARKLGKAHTAGFHVQAQNITYNISLGNNRLAVSGVYKFFNAYFYKFFKHLHCPSRFIANELYRYGYHSQKLHVISNGINDSFVYTRREKPEEYKDKIVVAMVGRLSKEKRQDILIQAAALSKYSDKIQLIFAGKGPQAEHYKELAKDLHHPAKFEFLPQQELVDTLSYVDIYVHSADIEIEAISCLEAVATGLVPVISDSVNSATQQFALDERSLFKAGDPFSLAEKIDYWIDRPEELESMRMEYARSADKYRIGNCAKELESMFNEAYKDNAEEKAIS